MKFCENQKLPAIDVDGQLRVIGIAGTQRRVRLRVGVLRRRVVASRSAASAMRCATSSATSSDLELCAQCQLPDRHEQPRTPALAQARLQRQQQTTNLRELETADRRRGPRRGAPGRHDAEAGRVDAEGARAAEQRLQAEDKRLAVGLSDTFRSVQAQRDLTRAASELNAIIAYNRALIDFEAVQTVPLGGGFSDPRRSRGPLHASVRRLREPRRPCELSALVSAARPLAAWLRLRDSWLGPSGCYIPRVKLTVTVITRNEAANIGGGPGVGVSGPTKSSSSTRTAPTRPSRSRGGTPRASRSRDWPGYSAQQKPRRRDRAHDWILALDADERVTPALAAEIQRDPADGARRARLSHAARHVVPRALDPRHRLVSRLSAAPVRPPRRPVERPARARIGRAKGHAGTLAERSAALPYRDISDHVTRIDHYTTLAAEQWVAEGRRTNVLDIVVHPPAAFLRNYVLRRGFRDGMAGFLVSALNSYYVFLKILKLWEIQCGLPHGPLPARDAPRRIARRRDNPSARARCVPNADSAIGAPSAIASH